MPSQRKDNKSFGDSLKNRELPTVTKRL